MFSIYHTLISSAISERIPLDPDIIAKEKFNELLGTNDMFKGEEIRKSILSHNEKHIKALVEIYFNLNRLV